MANVVDGHYFRILLDDNRVISYNIMTSQPDFIQELPTTMIDTSIWKLMDFNKQRGQHGEAIVDEQNQGWFNHSILIDEDHKIGEEEIPSDIKAELERAYLSGNAVFR